MTFPKNGIELRAQGYVFDRTGQCQGADCHATIEWWFTPKGAKIPLDLGTAKPHWATCPNAKDFRKGAAKC